MGRTRKSQALKVLRFNRLSVNMSLEELFAELDFDNDSHVNESDFVRWFEKTANKEVSSIITQKSTVVELVDDEPSEAVSEEAEEDAINESAVETVEILDPANKTGTAASAEADIAADTGAASEEEKPEADEVPAKEAVKKVTKEVIKEVIEEKRILDETVELSSKDLRGLFSFLLEDGGKKIGFDAFQRLNRTLMRVVRPTPMTADIAPKNSGALRQLAVGDFVEVLQGPLKVDSSSNIRLQVRHLSCGSEGWVTSIGNETVHLKECGLSWKVVKETILTSSFNLEDVATDEGSREPMKLQVGDIFDVIEWPKHEEKNGLLRLKGKVKRDGAVGWATIRGNQGTVFLQPA